MTGPIFGVPAMLGTPNQVRVCVCVRVRVRVCVAVCVRVGE
jgi:hypothetical protein